MNDKLILNLLIFVAFANIVSLASRNKIDSIVLFFASGILTHMYTKNKVYVILVALIAANALETRMFEGMANNGEDDDEDDNDDNKKEDEDDDKDDDKDDDDDDDDDNDNDDNGENFTNKDNTFEESDNQTLGKRVDYTTTLEQAYNNLQNILGTEGVSGLSKQTEKLLDQQKNLMDSLVQMGPIVDNAQKTMKGFKIDGLPDLFKK